jgi:hypothetical protein
LASAQSGDCAFERESLNPRKSASAASGSPELTNYFFAFVPGGLGVGSAGFRDVLCANWCADRDQNSAQQRAVDAGAHAFTG